MKAALKQKELRSRMDDDDVLSIQNVIEEMDGWVDGNADASKEELDEQLQLLTIDTVGPLLAKYGASADGGPPAPSWEDDPRARRTVEPTMSYSEQYVINGGLRPSTTVGGCRRPSPRSGRSAAARAARRAAARPPRASARGGGAGEVGADLEAVGDREQQLLDRAKALVLLALELVEARARRRRRLLHRRELPRALVALAAGELGRRRGRHRLEHVLLQPVEVGDT